MANNDQNLADGYVTINYGKSKYYYKEITVSNSAFTPSCNFMMLGDYNFTQLIIHATSGVKIEYSYNGTDVHGWCQFGTQREIMRFPNPTTRKIWVRSASGSNVNVELY